MGVHRDTVLMECSTETLPQIWLQIFPNLLNSSGAIIPTRHYFQARVCQMSSSPSQQTREFNKEYPSSHGSPSKIQCIVEIASSAGCKKKTKWAQLLPNLPPLLLSSHTCTVPPGHHNTPKQQKQRGTINNHHIKTWHMKSALQPLQAINKDTQQWIPHSTRQDMHLNKEETSSGFRLLLKTTGDMDGSGTFCHRSSTDHLDIAAQAVPRLYFLFILSQTLSRFV